MQLLVFCAPPRSWDLASLPLIAKLEHVLSLNMITEHITEVLVYRSLRPFQFGLSYL